LRKRKEKAFYVFASKEFPTFQRLLSFEFRKNIVKQAFASLGVKTPAAETETLAAPALAAAGLDALSKILGFFKTDFTVGGVEVKLDESLLVFSVAGALSSSDGNEAHLPMVYQPNAQGSELDTLILEMTQLVKLRTQASQDATQKDGESTSKQKEADDPANAANKGTLLRESIDAKAKADQLKAAIALYDAFATSLVTPESNGTVPLAGVAQEFGIKQRFNRTATCCCSRKCGWRFLD
jgi:hypothetical protein